MSVQHKGDRKWKESMKQMDMADRALRAVQGWQRVCLTRTLNCVLLHISHEVKAGGSSVGQIIFRKERKELGWARTDTREQWNRVDHRNKIGGQRQVQRPRGREVRFV